MAIGLDTYILYIIRRSYFFVYAQEPWFFLYKAFLQHMLEGRTWVYGVGWVGTWEDPLCQGHDRQHETKSDCYEEEHFQLFGQEETTHSEHSENK